MPTYTFILLSFYRFIELLNEAVGWRHFVPYPTYLSYPFILLSFYLFIDRVYSLPCPKTRKRPEKSRTNTEASVNNGLVHQGFEFVGFAFAEFLDHEYGHQALFPIDKKVGAGCAGPAEGAF